MPRYFFHVRDDEPYQDLHGIELLSLKQAQEEAVRVAGSLLRDKPVAFWKTREWGMSVMDENGLTLFELTFFAILSPSTLQESVLS